MCVRCVFLQNATRWRSYRGFRPGWDIVAAPHDPQHLPSEDNAAMGPAGLEEGGAGHAAEAPWHEQLNSLRTREGRSAAIARALQMLSDKTLLLFFSGKRTERCLWRCTEKRNHRHSTADGTNPSLHTTLP